MFELPESVPPWHACQAGTPLVLGIIIYNVYLFDCQLTPDYVTHLSVGSRRLDRTYRADNRPMCYNSLDSWDRERG